jgi:predicted GIY-YIG superfamily endonuclease
VIFTVYLLWAADQTLLYVGRSSASMTRQRDHQRTKAWWPDVAAATFEHFPSKSEAIARERELIERLAPRHNRMFVPPAEVAELLAGSAR